MLLNETTYAELLDFKAHRYFRDYSLDESFRYGLGVMDFGSMPYLGYARHGTYYGHQGVTYGFGSQSGVNYKYNFSASWISAAEVWMGPHRESGQSVYVALVEAIDQYRRGDKPPVEHGDYPEDP